MSVSKFPRFCAQFRLFPSDHITRCAFSPYTFTFALQKCERLRLDLGMSNETLLNMLEYGADPKEIEHSGAPLCRSFQLCVFEI